MTVMSSDITKGVSALTVATGLAALAIGAYLALWALPMRLIPLVFEPSLVLHGALPDLLGYVFSWITMLVGGIVVYRSLRGRRKLSPPTRSMYTRLSRPATILVPLGSALMCMWYVNPLAMGAFLR